MYTILVNTDNSLLATNKERIMQRSKLFDNLWFLVNPNYKGYDMSVCTVLLEYILPTSRTYCTEILYLSEERYNNYLRYVLPVDTNLTSESGCIELQLSFIYADLDEQGKPVQRVRKTDTIEIEIIPISAWSDIVPDSALSAIDQRIIKTDAQIKALSAISDELNNTKADNLRYNKQTSELQLVAGNKAIGNKVTIVSCDEEHDDDYVPVVEF